jgi:uncharacterized protein (TIGR00156 family)
MRATLPAIALGTIALGANADPSTGGFKGPDATALVTVAQAMEMDDEAAVKVQGYIVKAVGDEKYEFQDDSGTIIVEIDDEDWMGLEVGPTDRVELRGEIDKEWKKTELEAESIQLAP